MFVSEVDSLRSPLRGSLRLSASVLRFTSGLRLAILRSQSLAATLRPAHEQVAHQRLGCSSKQDTEWAELVMEDSTAGPSRKDGS